MVGRHFRGSSHLAIRTTSGSRNGSGSLGWRFRASLVGRQTESVTRTSRASPTSHGPNVPFAVLTPCSSSKTLRRRGTLTRPMASERGGGEEQETANKTFFVPREERGQEPE